MRSRHTIALLILSLVLTVENISPVFGQDDTIVTIAVPSYVKTVIENDLFESFETAHPSIKVVVLSLDDNTLSSSASSDLEKRLDYAQEYASYADVSLISSSTVTVETTRAGYFLNLAPLINSDPSFNTDDFLPKVWQSAQWDDGIWYIPVWAMPELLVYNIKAFDQAGLSYPNETWTFDDLAKAARQLTTRRTNGDIEVAGFQSSDVGLFFYGQTDQPLYDANGGLSVPDFNNPELPAFLDQWVALQKDTSETNHFDSNKTPLSLARPWQLINVHSNTEQQWAGALLPGGVAGLRIEGFAVSSGTLNPEAAYALANFMSSNPAVTHLFFGSTPARRSMVGVPDESSNFVYPPVSEDVQYLMDKAIANAVPVSELRFVTYLEAAISKHMDATPFDSEIAIEEATTNAIKSLTLASARRNTSSIIVSTAIPTPSYTTSQIVLHFGMDIDTSLNPDLWRQVTNDFLADNPSVGNIDVRTQVYEPEDLDKLDCYYQSHNSVSTNNFGSYLNLDPFIDADPQFDKNDFIGTVLDQVKQDDHIWAYPIVMQPRVLWYNKDLFIKAGLPIPQQDWTVNDFTTALHSLRELPALETAPIFVPGSFGNTYLLMLMAAYGAIPYDYRTLPPTINFTAPDTVEAIRQVLDLAKEEYIAYNKLGGNGGTFGGNNNVPITDDTLSKYGLHFENLLSPDTQDPARLVNFPHGQVIPVSYGIGAAYIRRSAQNPDACYKWIVQLAQHPNLFGAMPVRLSQLSDSTLAVAQGSDLTKVYQEFAATFTQPNILTFPDPRSESSGNFGYYIEPLWLNNAFDDYVLGNGDLQADLEMAQTLATAFRECTSNIIPANVDALTNQETSDAYHKQIVDCAVKVDPRMKERFSSYYQDN